MPDAVSRLTILALMLSLISVKTAAAVHEPNIWLAPLQPTLRQDGTRGGSNDFFSLFEPGAAWKTAGAHVSVFKIYPQLLRDSSDAQLRKLIKGLEDRHIALSLESAVLADTVGCGPGATHDRWMPGLVGRLKRLGGDLNSLAMVGPVVDGRNIAGPNVCHASIAAVAEDAARTVTAMRALYPKLEIGEIEPIGSGEGYPNWNELNDWFVAFRVASGQSIAFLHMDTEWGKSWHDDMRNVARQTRSAHVRFGVIYDGTPLDLSDASFAEDALAHADEVEALLGGPPDDTVIQSWQDYPHSALPDSDLTTMTGIVRAYVRHRTRLAFLSGRRVLLTTVAGAAVSDADVVIETHDTGPAAKLQSQIMDGTVPHRAASALFALRVHTECACSLEPVNLLLSGLEFGQSGVVASIRQVLQAGQIRSSDAASPAEAKLVVPADQPLVMNGPSFPVEADKPFAARFAWHVDPLADSTGFLSLIFLGQDGREIRRTAIPLHTSWVEVTRLRSDAHGVIALPATIENLPGTVRIRFIGNSQDRPTAFQLDRGHTPN